MQERVVEEQTTTTTPPAAVVATPSPEALVLQLQRTAGNRAVGAFLARRPAGGATAEAKPEEPKHASLDIIDYVAFLVGQDAYGREARHLFKDYYPKYRRLEVTSFEMMFEQLARNLTAERKAGRNVVIGDLVIVVHGKAGQLGTTLMKGGKRLADKKRDDAIVIEELKKLQTEFKAGKHKQFQENRREVLETYLSSSSRVIVKACEFGQYEQAVDALWAFFGGHSSFIAARDYVGFSSLRVGGPVLPTPEAAYKFLIENDLLPSNLRPGPDDEKAWIAKHLKKGSIVSDTFLVHGHENRATWGQLNPQQQLGLEGEQLKLRKEATDLYSESWSRRTPGAWDTDAELDGYTEAELVEKAHEALDLLEQAEEKDESEAHIGWLAWKILRYHEAWGRNTAGRGLDDKSGDPLAGLTMPGLGYDTTILSMKAAKRADYQRQVHPDAFLDAELEMPTETVVSTSSEDTTAGGERGRAAAPPASATATPSTAAPPSSSAASAVSAPGPGTSQSAQAAVRGSAEDLRERGAKVLAAIAAEEAKAHPDEHVVAMLADEMLVLHRKWSDGPGISAALNDTSGDPLAGLYIPGLFYDTNLLAMKAAKRRKPGRAAPKKGPGDLPLSDFVRGPIEWAELPAIAHPSLSIPHGTPKAALAGIARLARFKFPIEWKIDKPILKYAVLKKASLTFDGYLDWKGEKGEVEITAGGLGAVSRGLSSSFLDDGRRKGSSGKMAGGAIEGSTTLDEKGDWKLKGGIEAGESEAGKMESGVPGSSSKEGWKWSLASASSTRGTSRSLPS